MRSAPNDICEACGEPGYDGRRCKECGSRDHLDLMTASTLAKSNRATLDYCEGIVRKAVGK
jgi:hypothetical protein